MPWPGSANGTTASVRRAGVCCEKPVLGVPMRLLVALVLALFLLAGCDEDAPASPTPRPAENPAPAHEARTDAWPEVWSSNGFDGATYEFKTNCFDPYDVLEACPLWEMTRVVVEGPDGQVHTLE